ncbi:unnamed protein product [Haemonchus placei]|uniref:Rho-GAP domain-containing protein n=1 Tax=Haemonchus placei TaxID=6290 RepID=A0A0N4WQ99_HAEPC|nr:unnamed protein product [Haemonchus placei]
MTPEQASRIVEADMRAHSVVIFGAPEVDADQPPSAQQKPTKQAVSDILDYLDVEGRPTEIQRMCIREVGKCRLIECLFSSRKFFFQTLKALRNYADFKNVFIRRSMIPVKREIGE